MNVESIFYVYTIILVVTFINDICFSICLTSTHYLKWIAVNNIAFIQNVYMIF